MCLQISTLSVSYHPYSGWLSSRIKTQRFRTDGHPILKPSSWDMLHPGQQGGQPCRSLAAEARTTQKVKMVLLLSALIRRVSLKNKGKHTCRRRVLGSLLTWHCLYFSAWYCHGHLSWLGMDFAINLRGESILNVKYTKIFYYNDLFQDYLSFWFRGNKRRTSRYSISYVTGTFQDKWWCKEE